MNEDGAQVARIAAQIGSGLIPDNNEWIHRFTTRSTASPRETHTVAQRRTDGAWACSCRAPHCRNLTDTLRRLSRLPIGQTLRPAVRAMLASARTAHDGVPNDPSQ